MTTGKTIALTRRTFVGKVMSLLLNMLSGLVITFLPSTSFFPILFLCPYSQSYSFSNSHVCMWELDHKEGWALKNWCFWTVVLEKTLESPLDCNEIQPVHPKGDQSWIFIGRTDAEAETPILWPPDGKNWRQEEKGMTEDEMAGWHHGFNGHELE